MHKPLSKIERILQRVSVSDVIARHKKHADIELYKILADCLEICEVCLADKKEDAVLERLISELPLLNGRNRVFVLKSSDIYQRACRFVFHGEEHTANTNRYAICLREATVRDFNSSTIVGELLNGGINKFFLSRPNLDRKISTKCIRLATQITHDKNATITLRLKRNKDNSYKVVEFLE